MERALLQVLSGRNGRALIFLDSTNLYISLFIVGAFKTTKHQKGKKDRFLISADGTISTLKMQYFVLRFRRTPFKLYWSPMDAIPL